MLDIFSLFVDDFSRFTWFYSLETKDQALSVFKKFKILVENQFNATIKCLQSENGKEFISFLPFLNQSSIIHIFSYAYTDFLAHTPLLKMAGLNASIDMLLKLV